MLLYDGVARGHLLSRGGSGARRAYASSGMDVVRCSGAAETPATAAHVFLPKCLLTQEMMKPVSAGRKETGNDPVGNRLWIQQSAPAQA